MLTGTERWFEQGFKKLSPVPTATAVAIIVYGLCGVAGLLLSDSGVAKILEPRADRYQYWDTAHYVQLGIDYSCQAFYPLWPQMIQMVSKGQMALGLQAAFGVGTLLFLGSLPLTYWVFRRLIPQGSLALLAFWLYVLNPNSIFHSNGYTEGAFSALAAIVLAALCFPRTLIGQGLLLVTTLMMSALRPSLIQLVGAAGGAWVCVTLHQRWQLSLGDCPRQTHPRAPNAGMEPSGRVTSLLCLGAGVGYALYGLYCWRTIGNFWGPFQAQVEWGRQLRLRPLLLLLPRSLLNDLQGLYFPFGLGGLVGVLAYCRYRARPFRGYLPKHPLSWLLLFYPPLAGVIYGVQTWRLARSHRPPKWDISPQIDALLISYPFWFCLFMGLTNATIGFLAASDSLYSLARFVFAPPFFFLALGQVAAVLDSPTMRKFLLGSLMLSALGLIHQWYSWGNGGWVG